MIVSVREALNVVGQPVSIRELAQQRNESFPLSLRQFVGAPPPGRILRKVIPLELLQRKFDEFFNSRERGPLFQIRLNGKKLGQSTLTVAFDKPVGGYDHEDPLVSKELAGPGEVLEIPGVIFGTHKYRFSDVNSDGLTISVVAGQPVGLESVIHFEIEEVEMKVEDFPDIDFTGFNIKLKMEFGRDDGLVDLVGFVNEIDQAMNSAKITNEGLNQVKLTVHFREEVIEVRGQTVGQLEELVRKALIKRFINTDVSVDVTGLPDGVVAGRTENTMNSKIFEALKDKENRDSLNKVVTRWLVGGDFHVLGVESDDQALMIDYILPLGQLEPFPENPQPPLEVGLLANIDHIVVLMMENRSFDHMLGYLSKHGGRNDVDGLHGDEKNHYKNKDYPSFPLSDTLFPVSPSHKHESVVNQVNGGKMDGFVADFAHHYKDDGIDPGLIMGYYDASKVPVYDALAREFLICQHWFSAHPGPTFPNRFYTLTGRLNRDADGRFQFDNPHGDDFKPVFTKTIFDHLSERGISWHYYEHGYCFLRMFERYTFDNDFIVDARDPARGFFASARAGTLPSVSFIDPDFIDVPPGNDDGPPASVTDGQRLIADIVQALMAGPGWTKTLFVITYDEHGGFFDHVTPPAAIPVSAIKEYGVRVPTFVVSPWVDQGKVTDVVFDHTSFAKTIARRFMSANPPDMGERMAAANDLSVVLRQAARQDQPTIPMPPAPPTPSAEIARLAKLELEDASDFKGILYALRSRYPLRS